MLSQLIFLLHFLLCLFLSPLSINKVGDQIVPKTIQDLACDYVINDYVIFFTTTNKMCHYSDLFVTASMM